MKNKMKQTIDFIYKTMDIDWIMARTKELIDIELPQDFRAYEKSANYVYELCRSLGLDTELITFPADGKTTYLDMQTPIAWDVDRASLEVVKSPLPFADPVIADYSREPNAIVKHSTLPTGDGVYRLYTEEQVWAGADCRGALVLLGTESRPRQYCISPLLDLGAIGFVSDNLVCAMDTPDQTQWVNAATDDQEHWHVQAGDRDFVGFSITPRIGRQLRQAAALGDVEVKLECDGRRYEGEIKAVTALIPGEEEKEIWLLAHLYEPISNDNSASVICAIEAARAIERLVAEGKIAPLKYSIRLAFAMECYGYAALADHFGGYLGDRAVGAINLDCLPICSMDDKYYTHLTPLSNPFYGNYIYEEVNAAYELCFGTPDMVDDWDTGYTDDSFLNDRTVNLPVIMPEYTKRKPNYWHNGVRDFDSLDKEKVRRCFSLIAAWAAYTASPLSLDEALSLNSALEFATKRLGENAKYASQFTNSDEVMDYFVKGEKKRIMDFARFIDSDKVRTAADKLNASAARGDITDYEGKWAKYAEGIVCTRLTVGFPFDLIKLPKHMHRILPNGVLYGPMGAILSCMDGRKNLLQLIKEAGWEYCTRLSEKQIKTYIDAVLFLSDAGYVKAEIKDDITSDMIKSTLGELGISTGDTLLVHSSLSGCGHVDGGARGIIEGIRQAVGDEGRFILPTFTRPYIGFEGNVNRLRTFRPYSADDIENIWTGAVPREMAKRADSIRSAHVSHSWCGIGSEVDELLKYHSALDAPTSDSSPLAMAKRAGGKAVFFGCGLGSNTFIHYLEYMSDVPYLENAIVKYKDKNGEPVTEVIHKHVPGHRDFYAPKGINSKFYGEAIKMGLNIKKAPIGVGEIYVIDLNELYDIGMELFKKDPCIVLCDDESCISCRRYKNKK